jgi:protein-S-isoprenylcysteine O-methyltransferase Ste14
MGKIKNKLRYGIILIILSLIIIGISFTAGRWDWIEIWVFLAMYLVFIISWALFLKFKRPDLLKERMTAFSKAKKWDRNLMIIYWILLIVFLFTAALDAGRYQNFTTPILLKILCLFLLVSLYVLQFWSGLSNKYLSSFVRIQKDRDHQVTKTGPYRYIRHPMYTGFIISYPLAALFLNSLWALIPAVIIMLLFIIRTYMEDKTLQRELDGYIEYTKIVKYRLFPYVW